MEKTIIKMLEIVEENLTDNNIDVAFDLIDCIQEIVEKFAETINCPSNWREIGENLEKRYAPGGENENSWIYENMKLYEYEEV